MAGGVLLEMSAVMGFRRDVTNVSRMRREAASGRLFAVMDACGNPEVPRLAQSLGPYLAASLYRGDRGEELSPIAPYLVVMDEARFDALVADGWGDPWGIFIVSEQELEALRRHLRRFLLVTTDDGEELYFRYYDPRVLARFWEIGTSAQWTELMRDVVAMGWVDPDSYGVVRIEPARAAADDDEASVPAGSSGTPPRLTIKLRRLR